MTEKKPKRPRDPNQLAKLMVDIATGEIEEKKEEPAVIGSKGGKARAASISPKRRVEIAKRAAETRWGKTVASEAQTSESDLD